MRNKKTCDKCDKEISLSNFNKHYNSCKGKKEFYKQVGELFECPHCKKLFKKLGIKGHIWRMHTEEGGKYMRTYEGGISAWNKGLTEETNESVKKGKDKLRKKYKDGELIGSMKGKHHSEDFKKKMSLHRIEYLTEHPERFLID